MFKTPLAVLALSLCLVACPSKPAPDPENPDGQGGGGGGQGGGGGGGGGGATCGDDQACSGATPRCDTATQTCVACLPGLTDNCPAGERCGAGGACVAGCKNDSACGSGQCSPSGDCVHCEGAGECSEGKVCATGTCLAPCSAQAPCSGGRTCCDGACVDVARDINHCGSCGNACAADKFCSGTTCYDTAVANVCRTQQVTVVLDGLSTDDDAGTKLGDAVGVACSGRPVRYLPQDAGMLSETDGRPQSRGGELLVAAGGSFGQRLVGYLETSGVSTVYDSSPGNGQAYTFHSRDGGAAALVTITDAELATGKHDAFVIELLRDPGNGSLALVAYGFGPAGTVAGSWFLRQKMLTDLLSRTNSWYLYEWRDAASTGELGAPDDTDTFTLIGSGK